MPNKRDFVAERCARAIEAFKNHEIVDKREDRWRIARRDKDGHLTNIHYAEIVSLWGGRIYVGGDIDDCVFAYYGDHPDHLSKLRWMGCCKDVDYYVKQKAQMGLTDNGKLVNEFDAQVAEHDLDYYLAEELKRIQENAGDDEDSGEGEAQRMRDVFERAKELLHDDPHELRTYLYHELHDGDAWEWLGELGTIVSHRVVYAWAALRRLCELLDAVNADADLPKVQQVATGTPIQQ